MQVLTTNFHPANSNTIKQKKLTRIKELFTALPAKVQTKIDLSLALCRIHPSKHFRNFKHRLSFHKANTEIHFSNMRKLKMFSKQRYIA